MQFEAPKCSQCGIVIISSDICDPCRKKIHGPKGFSELELRLTSQLQVLLKENWKQKKELDEAKRILTIYVTKVTEDEVPLEIMVRRFVNLYLDQSIFKLFWLKWSIFWQIGRFNSKKSQNGN